MIKFFRKIRQSLLSENKFSKYLLYAFGEIILVVIGILIALQINNWNEDSKARVREQIYLESILGDLKNNLIEIHDDIKSNKKVIKSCDSLLLLANKGTYLAVSDEHMEELVMALGNYSKVQLEQGTISEILSAGSLQILKNKDIRSHVVDWERNFIEVTELETFARQYQEKYLTLLDKFLPFYKFQYVDVRYTNEVREVYFNHLELLNTVGSIRFVASTLNMVYTNKISEIENFIDLVEKELPQ